MSTAIGFYEVFHHRHRLATDVMSLLAIRAGRRCEAPRPWPLNAAGPCIIPFNGGYFPVSFIKFPKAVLDVVLTDTSFPSYFRVFLYLASRCNYADGVLHPNLSASDVASACCLSTRSVYRLVRKLRELGWLIGGSGLSGQLAGFKSRPYKSASDVKRTRAASVRSAIEDVHPNSPSRNGSHPKPPRSGGFRDVREKRDTLSFEEVLSRVKGHIPDR